MGCHVSVALHHRFKIPMYKTQKGCTRNDVGPTRGFTASPEVGPRVTVGTLKTGYPRVQAPSQDERQDGRTCPRVMWLPSPDTGQLWSRYVPRGSSSRHQAPGQLWDRHMPRDLGSRLLAQDSSEAATCPLSSSSSSRLLAQDSSEVATCPLGSGSRLLAQDSSEATTCPWLHLPPPGTGQLRSRHVPRGQELRATSY
jgi:hypothetical protein